jgi:hypothetical protein
MKDAEISYKELEYRTRVVVMRTAIGSEEFYKDFIEQGVNRAKEIIIKSLEQKKLSYVFLELITLKELENVEIRNWADSWKIDAFKFAIGGLELEDKKVKEENGIFSLISKGAS